MRMAGNRLWMAAVLLGTGGVAFGADEELSPSSYDRIRNLVRPHDGESRWREVDWLTSLHEARVKAAAEGKPILLWSGGGAPPLGGC